MWNSGDEAETSQSTIGSESSGANEGSGETAQMRRLIWALVGRV